MHEVNLCHRPSGSINPGVVSSPALEKCLGGGRHTPTGRLLLIISGVAAVEMTVTK